MKLGIVGYGYVGRAIHKYFAGKHQISIFDKYQVAYSSDAAKAKVNGCDCAFVSVPTPPSGDDWSCDLSSVQDAIQWLTIPTCIKSTIPPGTTDKLASMSGSQLAFSPEYIGESVGHELKTIGDCGFVIVGGSQQVGTLVEKAYRDVDQDIKIYQTSARTAELCKYMENAFLATKVIFVNQFYDLAAAWDVGFDELTELWKLDGRVGASHCKVTKERGFGGKCLPKDIKAIISAANGLAPTNFLEAVVAYNDKVRSK